jgi:molecular chaperone GrpE
MGSNDVPAGEGHAGEYEAEHEAAPADDAHGEAPGKPEKQAVDYKTQLLYMQADFENFRRRVDREKDDLRRYANEGLILELLNAYENLERALAAARKSDDQISRGLEMVYNDLSSVLQRHGLRPIDAVGKRFDPRFHEAVLQGTAEDVDEETVLEEYQRGYTLNSKVIRCAKVKVSKR